MEPGEAFPVSPRFRPQEGNACKFREETVSAKKETIEGTEPTICLPRRRAGRSLTIGASRMGRKSVWQLTGTEEAKPPGRASQSDFAGGLTIAVRIAS